METAETEEDDMVQESKSVSICNLTRTYLYNLCAAIVLGVILGSELKRSNCPGCSSGI